MDDKLKNHSSLKTNLLRNWWIRRKFLYYLKIIGLIWFDGNLPGNHMDNNKFVFYSGYKPVLFPGSILEIRNLGPDAMEYLANRMMIPPWLMLNDEIIPILVTEFDAYDYLFDSLHD